MPCATVCGCWIRRCCYGRCARRNRKDKMRKINRGDDQAGEGQKSDFDATKILAHLYLGGLGNRNSSFLIEKNITSIINASNLDPKKITGCSQPYDIEELVVPLWDSDVSNIHQFFGKAGEIIDTTEKSKGTVLVHCVAGISRSTTLVLAYLMKYKNMSLKDAYNLVKSKRKIIKPNPGFWSQLVEFEKEVFGKNSVQMIEGPSGQVEANENTRLIPDVYKTNVKI